MKLVHVLETAGPNDQHDTIDNSKVPMINLEQPQLRLYLIHLWTHPTSLTKCMD
ncbi:unnamed protein product, partial [Amoebophrya sp. A25]|eukprot:GSA25T00012610001.1